MLRGRLLAGMAAAVGGGGLGQLYAGYVPFLVRTLPYDVAELATYSQLTALQPRARAGPAADMTIGAPKQPVLLGLHALQQRFRVFRLGSARATWLTAWRRLCEQGAEGCGFAQNWL